jgi:WD40 repeat protein
VGLWDTESGECDTIEHDGAVQSVAFSADGQRLASGEDKAVHLWDTTGREVLGLHGHSARCGCVAFSPDGHRLASASTDKTIRIWDATPLTGNEGEERFTFTKHGDAIRSVALRSGIRRSASSIKVSVSGRGISTPGPTLKSRLQNSLWPMI